jgi:hypothetical protein
VSDTDLGFVNEGRWAILVSIDDAAHIGPEERKRLESSYSPHERDARLRGQPSLGRGAVYPVSETEFTCRPFQLPDYFRRCCAADFGWRTTACVWLAHDVENDVVYAYDEYVRSEAEPPLHATAIKSRGSWIPAVCDPAGEGRSQVDGAQLIELYRRQGVNFTPATNAVEAGVLEVWTRMTTGRLRVFSTLQHLLQEIRIYRRGENGKIIKELDHCVDCLRYGVVSGLGIAAPKPSAQRPGKSQHQYQYDVAAEMWRRR